MTLRARGGLVYVGLGVACALMLVVGTCVGSVMLPPQETFAICQRAVTGTAQPDPARAAIILSVRLPRVLCVALCGAILSIAGASMQGLLKNPLADGSTLGVSSGAALGAAASIALGLTSPLGVFTPTMAFAAVGAFASLAFVLALSWRLDPSLSTNTLILIGVIFSMFASALLSLIVTMASDKVREITFWTMGSLAGSTYAEAAMLLATLAVCGTVLVLRADELDAFSIGEDNARSVGVDVRRVRITVLVACSVLIGAAVSCAGTIGFVGLVTPHATRLLLGPSHRRLLPASLFAGAVFLLAADLVARTVASPLELPLGAVTSLVGSIIFVQIFYLMGRGKR